MARPGFNRYIKLIQISLHLANMGKEKTVENPARIKGRAIFRSRPSTKNLFCRPSSFSNIFFLIIARPKKHQTIVASPVLLQNWLPVLFFARHFIREGVYKNFRSRAVLREP